MVPPDRKPALKSELASDPEIGELVEQFVTELPERVDVLLAAYREGDTIRVRTIAHQLKGAAGGYGFPTIGDAAKQLEQCLRSGGSGAAHLEQIRCGVEELVELCRRASEIEDQSRG